MPVCPGDHPGTLHLHEVARWHIYYKLNLGTGVLLGLASLSECGGFKVHPLGSLCHSFS